MEPIYVIVHTPDGDVSIKYEGLGQQRVSDLLTGQGLTGTVVSKADHDAFVLTHKSV